MSNTESDTCSVCHAGDLTYEACPNYKHECLDCCGCPDHQDES